jgi:hypothetical protein
MFFFVFVAPAWAKQNFYILSDFNRESPFHQGIPFSSASFYCLSVFAFL